ncbi:deoxyguanosinetriphosphate triphosphohydrolase [Solemya velesiana gill symbiont]|uniref:Deoxyguanosinetriphosphate triphosphohydrolase n=2 Tax=Solemya velesiana gill symbiont TaxID=1918948 RepID=A0A1T2KXS7_9GAMM|nr:deoxyguanosinetriphosphate triphosphohydrolase [Solemya velesiana gill symbiont]
MQWSKLLSRKRIGSSQEPSTSTVRTDFQRDFDRIVFSSAFRRMQDKTQVFPLSRVDYIRTRLTHSLEASSIGRSLGTLVGEQIIKHHGLEQNEASDFGDICAAACLAHDIGNPPFGHSGEDAIRHWAQTAKYGEPRVAVLSDSEKEDFLNFEGNAQGFRILTRLQNPDNPGGLQLTCATLAAFTKYPRESFLGGSNFGGVSAKKQGFVAEDRERFTEVANEVGLIRRDPSRAIWFRHPLAFLVEAADDISYRVIDIEDGFRLGYFTLDEVMDLFWPILPDRAKQEQRLNRISDDKGRVEFLRAKVINEAIGQAMSCFLDHEEEIMTGKFDAPLLSQVPATESMGRLISVAKDRIYNAQEVVGIQTAGFQVIGELLERFSETLDDIAMHGDKALARSRMTSHLISKQFVGPDNVPSQNLYTRLLRLTDYVAGMTDTYAVSLYKKMTGISLPS